MAVLKFQIDTGPAKAAIDRALVNIKGKIPNALAAAINRTAAEGRTAVVRALAKEVTLKVSSIREVVTATKINAADVKAGKPAYINLKDSPRPLFDFPHREGKRGVTVRVRKNKPPERYRHYFTAKMKSGHEGIYARVKGRDKGGKLTTGKLRGKGRNKVVSGGGYARRLPIKEIFGPSLVSVFDQAGTISEDALANIQAILMKNVQSQISRFTKPKRK